MTLSIALCRPTSSRRQSSSPSAVKRPVACRPPVASNAACASRSRSGQRRERSERHAQSALDSRRLDGDRLERALAADAARRRRVEAPLQPRRVEARAPRRRPCSRRGRPAARGRRARAPPRGRSRARAPRRGPASASSPRPARRRSGSRAAPRPRPGRAPRARPAADDVDARGGVRRRLDGFVLAHRAEAYPRASGQPSPPVHSPREGPRRRVRRSRARTRVEAQTERRLEALHAAPGNPGIARLGECHPVHPQDETVITKVEAKWSASAGFRLRYPKQMIWDSARGVELNLSLPAEGKTLTPALSPNTGRGGFGGRLGGGIGGMQIRCVCGCVMLLLQEEMGGEDGSMRDHVSAAIGLADSWAFDRAKVFPPSCGRPHPTNRRTMIVSFCPPKPKLLRHARRRPSPCGPCWGRSRGRTRGRGSRSSSSAAGRRRGSPARS